MTHYDDAKETFRCGHGFVRGLGMCDLCEPSGPFMVQEYTCLPGDRGSWCAIHAESGITVGGHDSCERAEEDARALNAAFRLGQETLATAIGAVVRVYYRDSGGMMDFLSKVSRILTEAGADARLQGRGIKQ